MTVKDDDFYVLAFAGINKNSSKNPEILTHPTLKRHVEACLQRIFPRSLKLLRSYTEDDLEHSYIINVVAERPHPSDKNNKLVLCEWLENNKLVKFSVNIEARTDDSPTLCNGEFFLTNDFDIALHRYITRFRWF